MIIRTGFKLPLNPTSKKISTLSYDAMVSDSNSRSFHLQPDKAPHPGVLTITAGLLSHHGKQVFCSRRANTRPSAESDERNQFFKLLPGSTRIRGAKL